MDLSGRFALVGPGLVRACFELTFLARFGHWLLPCFEVFLNYLGSFSMFLDSSGCFLTLPDVFLRFGLVL